MRCVSCGADIPPEWVAAIEKNTCPGCGGNIMTESSQELMAELSSAISKMPNDPKGLAGWILSNYKITKIGSAEPTERFHRQGGSSAAHSVPRENTVGIKYANSPYAQLMGGGAPKPDPQAAVQSKASKLAQAAAMIRDMPDNNDYENYNTMSNGAVSEEDIETYNELMSKGIDPFMGVKQSALGRVQQPNDDGRDISTVGRNDNLNDLSKEEMELIARAGEKGRETVFNNRLKRIKAQDAMENGGGMFRRS